MLFLPTVLQTSVFSGVALLVSTNNLKINSAKHFTKPNKLNKQNEEASIL